MAKPEKKRAKVRGISMENREWNEIEKAIRITEAQNRRSCGLSEFVASAAIQKAREVIAGAESESSTGV